MPTQQQHIGWFGLQPVICYSSNMIQTTFSNRSKRKPPPQNRSGVKLESALCAAARRATETSEVT